MFKKLTLQNRSEVQKRYLSQIRQCTRQLIETANREERRNKRDPAATQPEDLRAVRLLRSSQREVMNAIELGVSGGLDIDSIRSQAIDRTFAETVVISDLALFMLEEISSTIEARHRK